MRKIIIFFFCLTLQLSASTSITKEAKDFAGQMTSSIHDSLNTDLKIFITDEDFDPNKAERRVFDHEIPKNDALDFVLGKDVLLNISNTHFEDEEAFLCYEAANPEETDVYKMETCRKGGAPSPVFLIRTLNIETSYIPEESEVSLKCLSHKNKQSYNSERKAKNKAEKLKNQFSKDPTIKSYSVDVSGGWFFSTYKVKWSWTHVDNAESCHNSSETRKVIHPEIFEMKNEKWVYEDEKTLERTKSPFCTFLDKTCLESDVSKIVNGKDVYRQCWKEKLSYICESEHKNECSFLKNSNCKEVSRKCLSEGDFGCNLWEIVFKCVASKKTESPETTSIDIDDDLCNSEYPPNDSFAEVSTKLLLFNQIKKEIEGSETSDARKIEIFSGQSEKCEKSVADDIFYDCCFSFKGLANQMKLANCNAEEHALAEKRENGLCHYVGSRKKTIIGVKTKDVHVFCCFGSKLSRVFQEQAKKQLDIDWGSPKHPNCGGIHTENLQKIDFSQLDLTEIYEESMTQSESIEQKLENFKKNLIDRLEKEEHGSV